MLKRTLFISVILVATVMVFSSGLGGEFVLDDSANIKHNPVLAETNPLTVFIHSFTGWLTLGKGITPVSALTYWTNIRLGGFSPISLKLFNIALHLLTVLALFHFIYNHIFNKDLTKSCIAVGFFAVNPAVIHAVVHISGRSFLMAALFAILSINSFAAYRKRPSRAKLILSGLFSVCAVLSHFSAVLVFFAIPLFDWLVHSNRKSRVWMAILGILLPIFVLALSFFASSPHYGMLCRIGEMSLNAPFLFLTNFAKIFIPANLSPFITPESVFAGSPLAIVIGTIFLLCLIILVRQLTRSGRRFIAMVLVLTAAFLFPSILTLGHGKIDFGGLYLPSMFAGILFAQILGHITDKIRARYSKSSPHLVVSIGVVLLFASISYLGSFNWTNEVLLVQTHLEINETSAPAMSSMANSMFEIDEFDSTIIYAQKAVIIDSTDMSPWLNMAMAYSGKGLNNAGLWCLERFEAISGQTPPKWHYARGVIHLNAGNRSLAREIFAEFAWEYPPAQFELGKLLYDTGKYHESVEVLKIAEKNDPFNAKIYYILSEAFEATGDNRSAREAWRRYLELPGIKTAEFIGDEDAPGVIPARKQED